MSSWSHQPRTLEAIEDARKRGVRRLCVQGPTGSGKTRTFLELVRRELDRGGRAVIYTDRKTIRAQISEVFEGQDLYHGVRAAGYQHALHERVQVSSIMTERARCLVPDPKWDLHDATLVVIDEAHRGKGKVMREIMRRHFLSGAFLTGWTATPTGIGALYDEMTIMATLSELRDAGVLVPCDVYAPEEIDLTGVKMVGDEFHMGQMRKRVREALAIGSVVDHYWNLNPEHKPAVLFAPGVPESRWLAEQFNWHCVPAEHIDASTSETKRREVFQRWREGETELVCNYGILREGFDFQECSHAILVQPTAKISTYLQIVGRVLRAAPGKERATLQDHTGAYWRHGSPNDDRRWNLKDTDRAIAKERKKQSKSEGPHLCPQCGAVRYAIPGFYGRCPICGYERKPVYRAVRQTDGKLVYQHAKPQNKKADLTTLWRSCIYAAANSGMTAGQCVAMYKTKSGRWVTSYESPWPVPHPAHPDWVRPAKDIWPWAYTKK